MKKYGRGYVQGTFDLFHVGHLNLFKRAKERCEYLIAGVVSDELNEVYKGAKPYVPYEERAALVDACKYTCKEDIDALTLAMVMNEFSVSSQTALIALRDYGLIDSRYEESLRLELEGNVKKYLRAA